MKLTSAKPMHLLGTLAAGMLLSVLPASAQTSALGGINGIVRDNTGAVVPGATVTIINTGTGAKRDVTADSEGHYAVSLLQPGTYEVIASGGASFAKLDRKNIPVTVGAATTVDAVLPAASVNSEVTVTTEVPLLDTEKVEQSQVVGQNIVSNVPVASRRFESFVLLTPNVVPDGTSGLLAYRGISGVYNTNLVDGGNNNQAFFGEARGRAIGSPYVFPVDAVSQFESSASGYSAELGGSAGGIINAITKSGSNNWHGDAYEYYRTPGWNALDPYLKFQGRSSASVAGIYLQNTIKVQNQFGVSFGGPIIKDKLFFHMTYDGFRKVAPIVYTSTFNSATNSVGNLIHLCDGGTTQVQEKSTTNGVTTTTLYPTTIPNVTAAQCSQAVAAVQGQLGSFGRNVTQDIYFPRLDYQLGQKTHISSEFLFENFHQPNGYNTSPTVSNGGVSQNGTADFHERILIVNAETALSSHTANAVHFQWARDLETDSTNTGGPANSLTGLAAFGETSALPRGKFPDEHRWQISDVYSLTMGRHTIKAGFDVNFIHEQIANLFGGDGSFSYSNASTEVNFANFVQDALGVNPTPTAGGGTAVRHYNSFSQTVDQLTGVGADDFWNQNIDGFVEDAWKATPKFLLTAGVRYDVQLVPGPDLPNTSNAAAFNATSQINPNLKMIQPRIGFNWNPQPGTVFRGGYGIFYGLITNSVYYTERRENGVYQKQYGPISATTAPTPYTTCATGTTCTPTFQTGNGSYVAYAPVGGVPIYTPPGPAPTNPITGAPITATGLAAVPTGTITIRGIDPSYSNPYSQSWDFTVEQQLPLHSTLTVGYVGNRGMRLPVYVDTNIDPASATNNHTYHYTNPTTGQVIDHSQLIYTNKLYTNTGTVATGFSDVNANYNSMVVTFRKPLSHGIEILANHTWAKAMDGGQTYGSNGTFNGTDAPLDPFAKGHRSGRSAEYARSDLDIRNRTVLTVLAKSNLRTGNKWVEYATNGWELSGTYIAQDGEPVTPTVSGTISYLTGGALGNLTTDAGVSNAAFTSGPSARVPDWIATRNSFKGPGLHNLDARFSRDFPIGKYHLELAAEAFNVVNHRNILAVNTAIVAYTAPNTSATTFNGCAAPTAAQAPAGSAVIPGTVGCLGPLSTTTAPFMSPSSTSSNLYNSRQVQILGKFTF